MEDFVKVLDRSIKMKRLEEERNSLRETPITIVPSCMNSNKTYSTYFGVVLDNICELDEVKDFIRMRGWKHCGDPEKEKEFVNLKTSKVPAFTLSTYARENESLKDVGERPRNPYIIVDIDFNSIEEVNPETFKKINSLPFVLGSSISISGLGYWSVVKIDISKIKSKKDWKKLYNELYSYYEDYDIKLDIQCSNINRLRVCSPYEFIWNDDFEEEYKPVLAPDYTKKELSDLYKEEDTDKYESGEFGNRVFKEAYQSGNNHWKRLSWANTILNVFGEDGEELYYSIFSDDPNIDNDVDNTWNWCVNNRNGQYKSNAYCLRKLEEMGWIRRKPQIIETINNNNILYNF